MFAPVVGVGLWTILWWICAGLILAGSLGFLFRLLSGGGAPGAVSIADRLVQVEEPVVIHADDLEAIEGVGPEVAALFRDRNLFRFADVAALGVAGIRDMLDGAGNRFNLARPFTWPFQAQLLANGQHAAFGKVVAALRDGVVDPTAIDGIGEGVAERLRAVDVASIEALARAEPAELADRLSASGTAVSAERAGKWIVAARRLMEGDSEALLGLFGLERHVLSAWTGPVVSTSSQVVERKLAETLTAPVPVRAPGFLEGWLWPILLGALGLALLWLLCFLGVLCPKRPAAVETALAGTQAVAQGPS